MSETSIEWTATVHNGVVYPGFTFNPWLGCTKVSAGCQHCYAEELMEHRYGRVQWGPTGTRQRTSADYWQQPLRWNRQAEKSGIRRRVFCASLADVFEDNPQVAEWRVDLFGLIDKTPNLDWLLLTKRPEHVNRMVAEASAGYVDLSDWGNVWIGTSVENQEQADKRIPELLNIPATVRFLSMEPLLGPVVFDQDSERFRSDLSGNFQDREERPPLSWIIVGGESGAQARPFDLQWALDIQRQCAQSNTAFFMKQMGSVWAKANKAQARKGGDPAEWPAELRVRQWPA